MKDIAMMEVMLEKESKMYSRTKDKKAKQELAIKEKVLAWLKEGKDVARGTWTGLEIEVINTCYLLTAKPVVFLVNIRKKDWLAQANKYAKDIKKLIKKKFKGSPIVPYSATFEQEVFDCATQDAKDKYLAEAKVPSQLEKIIWAGFRALRLQNYFTCGPDECKAW